MSTPLPSLTAGEIAEAVRSGRTSAEHVAQAHCDQIERLEPKLHALLHYDRDEVLAQAREVDRAGSKGRLAGVPMVIKDNIHVRGQPLSCASRILEGYVSTWDATVIERLRAEGAVFMGKANLDEFAMGSSCEHSAFGPTANPWDTGRVPGGSSGGSAAAVAARYAPLALGSDTGGSIRQPAALTGLVGIKPSYGRVSRFGLIAFGSSLDQIGPLARTVRDAALCLEVMGGVDHRDATSRDQKSIHAPGLKAAEFKGLRLGYVAEHLGEGCDPGVRKSVQACIDQARALGAIPVELQMPVARYGVQAYYIIAPSEASSNLSRFDGVRFGLRADADGLVDMYGRSRDLGFGPEVKRRIMLGTFALSSGYQDAYYKRALAVRDTLRHEYAECFERCDVIIGPTSPTVAFPFGANSSDPLKMYLCDIYTIGANLAGVPALSLPCGLDEQGLPIGLHLQAGMWQEERLLRVAMAFEAQLAFNHAPALSATHTS